MTRLEKYLINIHALYQLDNLIKSLLMMAFHQLIYILYILLGISLGMKYIHSQNVVHRDLKPDNILLDENFYPRISDFGSSSIANSNISQYIMKSQEGTPLYMPPEVFENESYDYKVDVYSFSLIAYELLTGNRPFS